MPSWKKVIVSGSDASFNSLYVLGGSISEGGFTGSLLGTASYAITASHALNVPATGYNTSASFTNLATWNFNHNLNSPLVVIQTFDSSYNEILPQEINLTDSNNATITFPTQESGYALASVGGVLLTSGGATGSVSASYAVSSSYALTASYVEQAQTASYIVNAVSASYALTASYVVSSSYATSSSLAANAGLAVNASNIALLTDTTDTTLYPVFSGNVAANGYSTLRGNPSGSLYYNSVTQALVLTTGSVTAPSFTGSLLGNAATATTASYALTASYTNPLIQDVQLTGSLLQSGSITLASGSMTLVSGSITMPNRPAFRVTGTGGAKAAVTALSGSYLNVDYQQGGGWDNSTGTFTAPIAGLYQVNVIVRTNSNTLGTISQLIVYKNNTGGTTGTTQIMIEFGANTTMNHAGGSTISKLAVGDTLKMVVTVGEISFDSNDNFSVAYLG